VNRGVWAFLFTVILGLSPDPAVADIPLVNILTKTVSVRAEALGGAGTALSGGPEMIWVNPASASLDKSGWELSLGGTRGSFDEITGGGMLGFHAWDVEMFTGFSAYDAGLVTLNASDGTTRKVIGQRDFMGVAAISGDMGEAGRQGLQVLFMRSEFLEEFSARTVAASWGLRSDVSDAISTGVSIRNFGPNLRYLDDIVTLPATGRAGVMFRSVLGTFWDAPSDAPNQLRLVGDAEFAFASSKVALLAGAELQLGGILTLRGGGRIGQKGQLGAVSAGFGVDMGGLSKGDADSRTRFRLDYAIRFMTGAFELPHAFSLTMVF